MFFAVAPAAFLEEAVFNINLPRYLNYGSIGTFIGHELIHAYDIGGSKYDKNGNIRNWWSPSIKDKLYSNARCLENQYNKHNVNKINFTNHNYFLNTLLFFLF